MSATKTPRKSATKITNNKPKIDASKTIDSTAELSKATKPTKTADEWLVLMKKDPDNAKKWSKVNAVSEMGKSGPTRVIIQCQNPQSKRGPDGDQVSVCQGTRDIAVQDLFQVTCCAPCQQRLIRIARRSKQKARDKQMREQIKGIKSK